MDTRISLLVDIVGSCVPIHAGQPCFPDQHRQTTASQVARPTDHYVQSEARGTQGTGAVVQPQEVSTTAIQKQKTPCGIVVITHHIIIIVQTKIRVVFSCPIIASNGTIPVWTVTIRHRRRRVGPARQSGQHSSWYRYLGSSTSWRHFDQNPALLGSLYTRLHPL